MDKIAKLDTRDFAIIILVGLFGITLFTGFWAIFYRVNWEFHAVLLLLNLLFFILLQQKITSCYKRFWKNLKSLLPSLKALFAIVTILTIAQCAAIPYIVDNETYYIHSVKWLNEYGFVKGLANLHPFLAQMSGWHVAQSAFSFSFLGLPFNDLSGFCLLAGNVFAITKLNLYFQNGKKLNLVIGLLPVANVLLFQFISAPSPDLPVYILTLVIVFYFIDSYNGAPAGAFKIMALLAVFCFYIKPTSVITLLFPLIYLLVHYKFLKQNLLIVASGGIIVLGSYVVKNSIVSGYPLFPFTGFSLNADYTLPKEIAEFYVDLTRRYAFHLNSDEFNEMKGLNLFLHWVTLPGLHGFFNKISIFLIFISPFVIYRYYNKKPIWIVYVIMCLQLVFLYLSSPQYRFFFNYILVFSLLFAALIFSRKIYINMLFAASTAITAFILFIPVDFSFMTKNELMSENSTFSPSTLLIPAPNSKTDTRFEILHEGNLNYDSPIGETNFWITGNGTLPCVNAKQLEYFKKKYGYIPQLRSQKLGDGFISKKVTD